MADASSAARRCARAVTVVLVLGGICRLVPGAALASDAPAAAASETSAHGIAMHGPPALSAGFTAYPYANPAAPKGGRLILGKADSFNSLNPFIIRGDYAEGLAEYVYETLLSRSQDEPFTLYGLIAERFEMPPDRSAITFVLRPEARFSDGTPVTADDVLFSHATLRDKGRPNHRRYYAKVTSALKLDDHRVRFEFVRDGDLEMPLIMGLMPILPRHRFTADSFDKTSLEPPVGSGPYVVAAVEAPRSLTYRRNPAWWGRQLPVNAGRFNVDEIRIEYFRDDHALFEAFRTGAIHLRLETDPAQWDTAYDFPAVRDGRVVRREFETGLPAPMRALAFNTRRPFLSDANVRRALILAFDDAWMNKNLFRGLFTRTRSFFHGSQLSSLGRPADAREKALLAPYIGQVSPAALGGLSVIERQGDGREMLREALDLLATAGYRVQDQRLTDAAGKPVTLEMLAVSRAQERLMLSYARNVGLLGIAARVRLVDNTEYEARKRRFDFDVLQATWAASLSPGNEQAFRWGSKAADADGSFNFAGIKNPAVDAMIEALLAAQDRDDFIDSVRALDRVLLSGHYVLPLFHIGRQWVAHWSHLRAPERTPLLGYDLTTWWLVPAGR